MGLGGVRGEMGRKFESRYLDSYGEKWSRSRRKEALTSIR